MTHEERLKRQRERRKQNGNLYTNRYEKTFNGFLMRKYRNMLSRVSGVQWRKEHLYGGLSILPREEFYKWAKKSRKLKRLFKEWKDSGYKRKICPSVNRIDSSKGYQLGNMEWITHSENSRLGNISRFSKKKI